MHFYLPPPSLPDTLITHSLYPHHPPLTVGIMVIFVAMVLVASTTFFAPAAPVTTGSAAGKDPRVGVVLVILGCMAQGVQCKYRY